MIHHTSKLLDVSTMNKIDKQRMYEIYDKWPQMALKSYQTKYKKRNYTNIDHIVFAGMGGSGAIGDLFSAILSKTNIHVTLVKGYVLPNTVDSKTLVVVISVSGNTVETLTVLNSAKKLNCKTIAFSSGGKLESLCKKHNIDFQKVELAHSPRTSFINYVYSILNVLESIIPIKKQDILQSINTLEEISKQINSSNLTKNNFSLSIAKWITGIPLIYYPWGLQAIAIRFKSSLQENAKSHVIIEDVIEASHNGVVSWERPSSIKPILLQGQNDYIKTKERWTILKEYFTKNKIDYLEIKSPKGSILTKLVYLIYVLDYASIYRAILNKTDPSPVKSIDFIKKRL